MNYLKTFSAFLLMLYGLSVHSQQQAMFTQYMFNATTINPAVAGTHEATSLTALVRQQWVGIEGAPNTQSLSIHSPFLSERIGLGLNVLRDEIGITTTHGVFGAYAYRVKFQKATLSLGLQAGFTQFKSDQNDLNPNNPDPALQENYQSGLNPNFGTGAYLYSKRFYIGISAPMLVNHSFLLDGEGEKNDDQRKHYFLMTGYVFDLTPSLKLKPNLLVKAVDGAPLTIDLNANLLIDEFLWLGLSYRSFDSVDALIELQLKPELRIGYAHDFTTSDLSKVNRGTHEIMVNFLIKKKNKKTISPRYF